MHFLVLFEQSSIRLSSISYSIASSIVWSVTHLSTARNPPIVVERLTVVTRLKFNIPTGHVPNASVKVGHKEVGKK